MIDFRCWNSLVLGKSIAHSKVELIEACKIIKDVLIFYYCTFECYMWICFLRRSNRLKTGAQTGIYGGNNEWLHVFC